MYKSWVILFFLYVTTSASALESLSDSVLSKVQGQSGLTVEQSQLLNVGKLSYTDDGNSLDFEGLRISSQADINASSSQRYIMDIAADGSLSVLSTINPTQMHIDDIRINNSTGSFGDLTLNFEAVTDFTIKGMNTGGLEGRFTTGISNAEMIWQTNGFAMSFNNIGFNASIENFTIEYDAIDNTKEGLTRTGLALGMENFDFSFSSGALSLGGVSLGELSGQLALSATAQVFAGGRDSAQGLTLHSQVTINQDTENYVDFSDDGSSLRMENFNGSLALTNLTFDVELDHLAIGFDELEGTFNASDIYIGDNTKSIGGIGLDFSLVDDEDNNRFNRLRLTPGITNPGFPDPNPNPTPAESYGSRFYSGIHFNNEDRETASDGLSITTEWNLANANIAYIDDGNRAVIISDIKSYGSANATVDIRDKKIAVGVTDLIGSYSIAGLKVGSKDAPIQGGAELLLSLEVFQAMDFDIDGYTTITAGGDESLGNLGGITIDGDYFFTNTNIGLSIDENEEGIWATDVNYDIHLRDITFDVASNFTENDRLISGGVKINRGEQWSTMDIGNLRWGNKTSERSLGRVKLERFEQNSSLAIIPGGAGAVCVGGSLNAAGNGCSGSTGRFEDRGNKGMTISLKAAFANAGRTTDDTADARNRLTWENNREETIPNSKEYINDTGTQIIFENFSTNDGLGTNDDNTYGLQANLNIDVFETKVLKKSDGVDANGVVGSFGEELIYTNIEIDPTKDPIRGNTYSYVASPDDAEKALRPLGFAVQGNVSFKELNIAQIQLKHPNVATPEPVFYGVVMQNFNLTTNLTATPIQ
jgi:hypothetical protein